jgi:hypothetical protein
MLYEPYLEKISLFGGLSICEALTFSIFSLQYIKTTLNFSISSYFTFHCLHFLKRESEVYAITMLSVSLYVSLSVCPPNNF